jgi:hypothetical protein
MVPVLMRRGEIIMKWCSKCKTPKLETGFSKNKSKKDGLSDWCKACCSEIQKQWRKANSEKNAATKKYWCEANPERNATRIKQWRMNNPEKIAAINKRTREKKLSTHKGRLNQNMSSSICRSLKRIKTSKNGCHWETLVGYKVLKLKFHLESLFTEGMNWGNYGHGKDKWCIDHKKPIVSFNFNSPEDKEFKKCWALKNLQPMWCNENFSKQAKLNWKKQHKTI